MIADASLAPYLFYGVLILIAMWVIDVVEPIIERLSSALGSGLKHVLRWAFGTRASGPNAGERDDFVEEAKAYVHDWRLFFVACVAKFAKSDGVVTRNEIAVVEEIFGYMDLTSDQRRQAIETFHYAKQGRATLRSCIRQCVEWQEGDTQWMQILMLLFFKVAHADGPPNARTQRALEKVCDWSGMDYKECAKAYAETKRDAPRPPDDVEAAYMVLGCRPMDTLGVIKDRYRKLVKDYHPDMISGKNLAPDFLKFAEERFKQIQAAYETIMAARGAKAA